jgi:ribosomal protein L40E
MNKLAKVVTEEDAMVYCTKCGTKNADDATMCVNCGASLYGTSAEEGPYWRHRRYYEGEYYQYHRRSGAIAGIVIGTIILLIGFSFLVRELYNVTIPWFEVLIILLGIYIIARALTGRGRRR